MEIGQITMIYTIFYMISLGVFVGVEIARDMKLRRENENMDKFHLSMAFKIYLIITTIIFAILNYLMVQ